MKCIFRKLAVKAHLFEQILPKRQNKLYIAFPKFFILNHMAKSLLESEIHDFTHLKITI